MLAGFSMSVDVAMQRLPREVLAKMACEFICHRWPVECPIEKPHWFDRLSLRQKCTRTELIVIRRSIFKFTTRYDRGRAWHMLGYSTRKKTEEEFNAWWSAHEAKGVG